MNTSSPISVFVTTKNEEKNLPYALASVVGWVKEIYVLDSNSTDRTREIAESFGAKFVVRAWEGYSKTKNWGLDNLPWMAPWVFILDADEVITPALRDELIEVATKNTCEENAFNVNRYFIFLGKRIRHCGYYPSWNVRFLRLGKARYEDREVHEHMIVEGKTGFLNHDMEHYDRRGIAYYIAKHNEYSTLEAREMVKIMRGTSHEEMIQFSWHSTPAARRRWVKHVIWPKLPARWLARFFFMYILRAGFLDGRVGFNFCLFMASYEHQIALKIREMMIESDEIAAANAKK